MPLIPHAVERGFTLVELLVVILIIGVLAVIAIPSFLGQRERGVDARSKDVARKAQTAIETWATDREGSYVAATPALLRAIEPTLPTSGVALSTLSPRGYVIVHTTVDTPARTFTVTRATTGRVSRTCGPVARRGKGGCSSLGTW